jgi:hypothetical protein
VLSESRPSQVRDKLRFLLLKSGSNLIFAASVLVSGRERRPLLPELGVAQPEYSLSKPEHALSYHSAGPILAPFALQLQFPAGFTKAPDLFPLQALTKVPSKADLGSSMGLITFRNVL